MFPINYSDLAYETMDLGTKLGNEKKIEKLTNRPGLIYRVIRGPETFVVKGFSTENLKYAQSNLSPSNFKKLGIESESEEIKFYPTYSIELADNLVKKILNQRFSYKEGLVQNFSDPGTTSWLRVEDDCFKICLSYPGDQEGFQNIGVLGNRKDVLELFSQIVSQLHQLIPSCEFNSSDVELSLKTFDKANFYFQSLKDIFYQGKMEDEIIEYFGPYLEDHLLDFLMESSSLRGLWKEIKDLE
ncbi:MAG: hypothetical protein DRQ88_05050 [Epsilonproteobacteria bacterium]|nr:MAG: hypothetical protein DRQ89_11505 [Campylobacterota bacterium]RLA66901.1 MAG: hypothetical protein DRQ88_05050 [Campylobacterota bacterium]